MVDSRQEHIKIRDLSSRTSLPILQTSPQGLSSQEVKERQATYGPNQLKESKKEPIWLTFFQTFLLVLWHSYCGVVALLPCFLIV